MSIAGRPDELPALIEQYATMVRSKGFWLEVVDAEMICRSSGRCLVVGVDNADEPLRLMNSVEQFGHLILPGDTSLDAEIDPTDRHTCVLISCNASYRPDGPKNHWVPGFFKGQISKDDWYDLSVVAIADSTHLFREKRAALWKLQECIENQVGNGSSSNSAREILATQVSDLEMEVTKLLGMTRHY